MSLKKHETWIEWISTVVLIVGVALTAYNIYPMNIYVSFAGNFGWLLIGWLWHKWSLIIIQIVITVIYIGGLLQHYGVI